MQIMPLTGAELGVGDIRELEPNIHGGIKYIRWLISTYLEDEPMDPVNKMLFAFASYNAGSGRIRRLRRESARRGRNPNVWFGNVEQPVSERIGRETVDYVSAISLSTTSRIASSWKNCSAARRHAPMCARSDDVASDR